MGDEIKGSKFLIICEIVLHSAEEPEIMRQAMPHR